MRALVIIALVGGTAVADDSRPDGFDHQIHDRQLVIGGGASLPCARCHVEKAGRLVGRPDHKTCFGDCHGAPPRAGSKADVGDRRNVCAACHAPKLLDAPVRGTLAVAYPPYTLDRDWTTAMSHRRHRDVPCASCHATGRPLTGHPRCAGCHDGSGAAGHAAGMSACTTCHTPGSGTPLPPRLDDKPLRVGKAFSHAKHAVRSPAGRQCTTCHAEVRETDADVLPQPSIQTCAQCHDGKAAFSVITACTRCHREPPVKSWTVARPDARFVHAAPHDKLVASMTCNGCHPLSPHGEATVVGHAPCTSSTCHPNDFASDAPKICGACHNSTEPWRPLTPDRRPPDHTEFGANLDHAKHPAACTSCHSLTTAAQQLRPSRGHASCVGSACHAPTSGPAPHLDDCVACHQLDLVTDREKARAKAPWTARERFDHRTHARKDLSCETCHQDMTGTVATLHTPPKASCAPCHDGRVAFDLTGTTCRRCHGDKRAP